jgi:hypothetical protein
MSTWQPIETAPKGPRILVRDKDKNVHIAAWATYFSAFHRADMTGWWDRQDWYLPDCVEWMPLP